MLKKCSKCKEEKKIVEFSKDKTRKDGYYHQCKSCRKEWRLNNKEKQKKYYDNNKERIKERDKKYYKENKEIISIQKKQYKQKNKENITEQRKQYRKENKEYINKYGKQYYEKNKGKIKKWHEENKEKRNEYARKYNKQRKQTDSLFKLRNNIGSLICHSMKNKGYTKRSKTFEILGCSYEEFKLHIEKQFKDGMSWENTGQWHYDHIYPVSLAKDEEELIKLNHYTNFQPLWAIDNLKKGNKII
jgi:hypothetical protein